MAGAKTRLDQVETEIESQRCQRGRYGGKKHAELAFVQRHLIRHVLESVTNSLFEIHHVGSKQPEGKGRVAHFHSHTVV